MQHGSWCTNQKQRRDLLYFAGGEVVENCVCTWSDGGAFSGTYASAFFPIAFVCTAMHSTFSLQFMVWSLATVGALFPLCKEILHKKETVF